MNENVASSDKAARRLRIAGEVFGIVFAGRGLMTELRKGRKMQAGQAALRAAAAIIGTLIAIREIHEEAEDDE